MLEIFSAFINCVSFLFLFFRSFFSSLFFVVFHMVDDFSLVVDFVLEKMSETRIPGLAISIVENDEVVFARGFGFRDIGSGALVGSGTLFGIGSVTKSFTALAIMKLVERGLISLDDPVDKFVSLGVKPFGENITIHHLLTHSSGLPALAYAEAFIRGVLGLDDCWLPITHHEDIVSFMKGCEDWVVSRPGERFFYLNEGYVLLGYIISKVSGKRYEEFVRDEILRHLGMNRTFFTREEIENDGNWATPYVIDRENKHVPSSFPFGISADGGLISNVLDLTNYLRMYINRGEFNGVRIVDNEFIELMEREYIKLPYELIGGESYGYGWSVVPNFHGYKLVDHSGSVLVHTAYIGYIPEKRIGVAILANASGYSLSHMGKYVLTYMLGKDPEELEFIKMDRILNKLQGVYKTFKGTMKLHIKRNGDFLMAITKDRLTETSVPLVPVKFEDDYVEFFTFIRGAKLKVEFVIKEDKIELLYERYKLIKEQMV